LRKVIVLSTGIFLLVSGCVSIDDPNVHVVRPSETDIYQRNVLNKCPPHTYPHRLVMAQAGNSSILTRQGQSAALSQAQFDDYWNTLTPILDPNSAINSAAKPVVNFDREIALFIPMMSANSCTTYQPFGDEMSTDCYNITISIFWKQEGQDCQTLSAIPVFLYIYPKTEWPVIVQMVHSTPTPTPVPTVVLKPTPTATIVPTPTPEDEEEE
jgi:hypothetical protein